MQATSIIDGVTVGVGATLVMDLWNLVLKRVCGIASLDLRLLGRWLCHIPAGTFRHSGIAAAAPRPFEFAVGVTAHYAIGVAFAWALLLSAGGDWLSEPTLLPALLFGVVTVVFPFFLMQPALGYGVASSRAPNPTRARLKSLMSHSVFGLGLYLCALAVRHFR